MERITKYKRTLLLFIRFLNIGVLTLLMALCWYIYYSDVIPTPLFRKGNYLIVFIYLVLIAAYTHLNGGYKIGDNRISESIYTNSISLLFVNIVYYLFINLMGREWLSPYPYLIVCILQFLFIIGWSIFANKMYFKIFKPRTIVYIYQGEFPGMTMDKMCQRYDKYNVQEILEISEIYDFVKQVMPYDAVVIDRIGEQQKDAFIKLCYGINKRLYLVPDTDDVLIENSITINLLDTPLYLMKNRGLSFEQELVKRFCDLLVCIPAVIILSPLFILVSLCIKLEDHGPIFYRQNRLTKDGHIFSIYKFRSMIQNAEAKDGAQIVLSNDDRITKVGKVIRKFRLDELPQLFNIVKGDMSIVGPRPERPELAEEYYKDFPDFKFRLNGKAGLTGLAQVM